MGIHTIRATDIVGTHVENWARENMGTITDIMIDKQSGEVAYLVLSYPGLFGQRYPNKRFAIPFGSIVRYLRGGVLQYILNADQAFLEKSPGFDIDNWPDFADPKFDTTMKDYYKDISLDIMA